MMISAWWLIIIIPASAYLGMIITSLMVIAKDNSKDDSNKK